uniref:SET and MYND domain-containing protein 4 n=1 Tax=Schistocephalus solidus TaxID=70667 RepID=A0A0X3NVK7_SCHSO
MDPVGTATSQPIFQAFIKLIVRSLPRGSKDQWPVVFENCLTDFDRVLCLLNLLIPSREVADSGAQVLGLHPSVPLCENSQKSDVLAAKFREIGNGFWRSKACMEANTYYNLALFHSQSNMEKALALGNRSCVLYRLECYQESANDVTNALKLGFPSGKSDRLHVRAGQCFLHLGCFLKASEHFSQALQSLADPGLRRLAIDGLAKCKVEQAGDLKVTWRCVRGDPSAEVYASGLTINSTRSTPLLSANTTSGTSVRLFDAGPAKGWTLETTRNVKPANFSAKPERFFFWIFLMPPA